MKYTDYIRAIAEGARGTRATLALCLFLLCPAAARAQEVTPPAPSRMTPPPAAPVAPAAPAAQTRPKTPARNPRPVLAPTAPAPAARTPPPNVAPAAPLAPRMPREVVTVIHRLSGWKLLAWLATSGPPALELDEWPSASDSHTNIVAGYVYGDGRSVVARLPQAEVELEAFEAPSTPPPFLAPAADRAPAEPEYTLVTPDGRHVEAKFIGVDSSTGLAMLEAGEPLLKGEPEGDQGDTDDPMVGQRVRLYAPIPAEAPAAPAAPNAPLAPPPNASYIYLSIDQKEGRLTHLVRAPSGRLSSVVVSADVSPEWVGAVAANELGEVVGIVSQSRDGETRVVPMTTVREACARVLKLRGTVPQPWLGARGDAAAQAPLYKWKDFGWPQEFARSFIVKSQGILLDSVAPGTPAALAGLRAGDLITSVGPRAVRNNEDLSMTLKEAGVGTVVDFTVWRAATPEPLKVSVELKGVKNPAQATAEAERSALRASLLGSQREIREMRAAERRLRGQSAEAQARAGELTLIAQRIAAAEERSKRLREQFEQAQQQLVFSQKGAQVLLGPQALAGPEARARDIAVTTRLRTYGLHAIGLSSRSAAPLGAQGGLLVVAVQPESPAAASGLLPGDLIETVNGSPLWRFELRRLTTEPDAEPAVLGLIRGRERLNVNFPPAPAPERQR